MKLRHLCEVCMQCVDVGSVYAVCHEWSVGMGGDTMKRRVVWVSVHVGVNGIREGAGRLGGVVYGNCEWTG